VKWIGHAHEGLDLSGVGKEEKRGAGESGGRKEKPLWLEKRRITFPVQKSGAEVSKASDKQNQEHSLGGRTLKTLPK